MSNVLTPLEPPFSPQVAELLARYPKVGDSYLSLFRTFANSTRFLEKGVTNHLDKASPLDLRQREIAILRTTARLRCEYEWGVHVAIFARAAGFSDDQIAATCLREIDPYLWARDEVLLLRCVDRIQDAGTLDDDLKARFEAQWSLEQQLEIIALCGTYRTVSSVANIARLPGEPFAARFPVSPEW